MNWTRPSGGDWVPGWILVYGLLVAFLAGLLAILIYVTSLSAAPHDCEVMSDIESCRLLKNQLCTWSRMVYIDEGTVAHAVLVYESPRTGKIFCYDVNSGTYALEVPAWCHEVGAIARALHGPHHTIEFID